MGLYPSSCSCEEKQARPASGLQYMTCPPYSLSRFKKWQKCSEIFCMHSFGALIGRVVRRQNVICDTPTSLGAREQPDNLILTRLATNAGHRAMSNLHSTIYNLQSHRDLQPHPPHLHSQHDLQLSTCQIPILEPVRLPLPLALQSQAENLTYTNLDPYLL